MSGGGAGSGCRPAVLASASKPAGCNAHIVVNSPSRLSTVILVTGTGIRACLAFSWGTACIQPLEWASLAVESARAETHLVLQSTAARAAATDRSRIV